MNLPCKPDHNGECLICDCWLSDCAWQRMWNGDFKYETLEQLLVMFKDYLTPKQKLLLTNRGKEVIMVPNEGFAQEQFEPEKTLNDYASEIRLIFERMVSHWAQPRQGQVLTDVSAELKRLIDADTLAEIIETAKKVEEKE